MSYVVLTRPSTWTLRSKLVAGMLALFGVVMPATGALTVLATRQYLTTQLSNELLNASQRVGGFNPRPDREADGAPAGLPGSNGSSVLVLGLVNGSVAVLADGTALNHVVNESNTDVGLDSSQVAELQAAQLGAQPKRVNIGGDVGSYLLIARQAPNGVVYITGVPTKGVDDTVANLLTLVAGGTILGLVAVFVAGTYLVRRNLEPLSRVAGTARRVSQLKLDSGDGAVAARVPESDTDPHTEVGQVGLALNSMLDNVEGALQSRHESEMRVRQFVADASHELRTPLASIRGYAELSRREKEPVPASVTHAIGRVESESLRMQELVEDLLLLARLDSGRPLERQPVDLTLLAMDAVSDAHAASPDHRWELDLPEDPVEVPGDQARLHQILANLLANARTHTPSGTTVVTRLRHEGGWVRMSVEDDGPGIPESLQRNVFQRFTRGEESRSRAAGSTGLGLSIVAAVGQAHGGRVELDSRPGDTTFSVLLPAT